MRLRHEKSGLIRANNRQLSGSRVQDLIDQDWAISAIAG
ncbi:UNVERIFIED_ORG: hypothetical protein M2348_001672 [Sphingomonas sp. R1F5B]